MANKTGMSVDIYRSADGSDCTNGGMSAKYKRAVVIGIEGPFSPSEDSPALYLVKRIIAGKPYYHVQPSITDGKWYMFGGNYVATSDSRFREICGYPIAIHDRTETAKETEMLTR